jgi:metal-responsive CopG/Arc/MetJ family transcriptional regulator
MPRGRNARVDRPTRWEVSLPTSLAAEIELYLFDPVRRKQAFGSRSALVQRLLREWLDKQKPQSESTLSQTIGVP